VSSEVFFAYNTILTIMNNLPSDLPNSQKPLIQGGILLIDNYDSFTYNIREQLARIGVDCSVVRNDEISLADIQAMDPSHIIVGPGPGTPENPEDIGVTSEAISYAIEENKALLGVCLGHQALVSHFGGKIVHAKEMMHGKTSPIHFVDNPDEGDRHSLFHGIDDGTEAMRYHSLVADAETFPSDDLEITAETDDGVIMGVRSKDYDIEGLQFHPESYGTPEGEKMMRNFLATRKGAFDALLKQGVAEPVHASENITLPSVLQERLGTVDQQSYEMVEIPCELPPEEVYRRLHKASDQNYCFESLYSGGGEQRGIYSYFGAKPEFVISARNGKLFIDDEEIDIEGASPFDLLNASEELLRKKAPDGEEVLSDQRMSGGFVGALTFEAMQYQEPGVIPDEALTPEDQKTFSFGYFPDGLVYDSELKKYFYYSRGPDRKEHFMSMLEDDTAVAPPKVTQVSEGISQADFEDRAQSVIDNHIIPGDTFQTVLSRKKEFDIHGSMADIYTELRMQCPSGNMHAIQMGDFESIGSFPELTLSIENGLASTYQVAGTRRRTGDPVIDDAAFAEMFADPKERAEHIMLVDLARNDIARSGMPGTQEMNDRELMTRLDAGTVMHMASRVMHRTNGLSPLNSVLSLHPMGTVSGAPKPRSTRILYAHEDNQTRGLYGGSIGFIDQQGSTEMVVGLRSVMRYGNKLVIQAGAGIVADSDPLAEFKETEKKMGTPLKTIESFLTV